MRKFIVVAVLCLLGTSVYAQKGEMSAGAQFQLGAGQGFVNPGLGAKFTYSVTDNWRLAASFDYGFKNKSTNVWDVNVDVNYQFFFGKGFRAYPLLGLVLVGYNTSVPVNVLNGSYYLSSNTTCFGANIGAGFQYDINDQWGVYTEMKGECVSLHGSRFVWNLGGCFKF